jgi:hypothetical protein
MKKEFRRIPLFLLGVLILSMNVFSQQLACDIGPRTVRAYSLATSNSICLVWPENPYRLQVRISRRVYQNRPSAWQTWSDIYNNADPATAPQASEFCDTNVSSGIHYEYQIATLITNYVCSSTTTVGYWDYQYVSAGVEVPLKEQRGKLILLVESGLASSLNAEVARLEQDLVGDGYELFRHDVAASEVTAPDWKLNVASVKALVREDYNSDPAADWTIFIVGHVPVPYSGLSSPGSHADNFGAHPSDWYYADMDESLWTDTTANDTTATFPWTRNIPEDGKFDATLLPSTPELRIGRIDLRNMPAFGKTEVQLMRQYLDRNHAWRHKQFTVRDRGLIFTAGIPYESHDIYASFFGSITNADLGSWLSVATNVQNSYLFASSKGSGGYDHDNNLGPTTKFATNHLYAVFTTMYGSYYGDWDSAMITNCVQLAPLSTEGYVVSTYYHENFMDVNSPAMGESIGYELYAMGANWYQKAAVRYNPYARVVNGSTFIITERLKNYMTLMGDPTLRWRPVAPPRNVTVTANGGDNVVSWTRALDENVKGYHVYRAPTTAPGRFTRITSAPVPEGSYTDAGAAAGAYRYMIRTVKLEESVNRSYYNGSQGITAVPTAASAKVAATFNPAGGRTLLISGETGAQYTVENTTNLTDIASWTTLTNITLADPTASISVTETNPVVFYRAK